VEGTHQFAAMMGFPSGLTFFDFGLSFIFGIEDLFFFFWSSRPIFAAVRGGWWVGCVGDAASSPSAKFRISPTFRQLEILELISHVLVSYLQSRARALHDFLHVPFLSVRGI
jgi:hypothetical protein